MEEIVIHSHDSEVSRRLARMLEGTSYTTCIIDDLGGLFELNTTKPMLIIIECQSDCLSDEHRIELIKKLSSNVSSRLLLISTGKQIEDVNAMIKENQINFLAKPILYTNFIREVDEIMHSTNPA